MTDAEPDAALLSACRADWAEELARLVPVVRAFYAAENALADRRAAEAAAAAAPAGVVRTTTSCRQ